MRNLVLALGALAAIGIALPVTSSAQAEGARVVVKHGDRDHGMHRGWEHHHAKKVIIVKHRHRHD